mgnify:CR=1 FL=1
MADHYFNQADAEQVVGGAAELRQHFKVPASTGIDADKLEFALNMTDGQIRKAIGLSWDLDAFDALWFNKAVRNCPQPAEPWDELAKSGVRTDGLAILRKCIWLNGDKNQAVPQVVIDEADKGMAGLQAQGARYAAISSQIKPASDRYYALRSSGGIGTTRQGTARRSFRGYT